MIEKHILENNTKYSLFSSGDTVTVALSGGADSVCLLFALNRLKDTLGISLKAVHLNHQIRGDEALRDEEFVKKLCNDLNIPLICESANVPKLARNSGLSLEAAARQVRYKLFECINEGTVATAHTASDSIETVILNLARGSGINGLCGIPVKRDYIVRPIISATREEVENYCKKYGLSYVTDSSNLSDEYTRNKIRHKIIPLLKEINPKAEISVLNTTRILTEISNGINEQVLNYTATHLKANTLDVNDFKALSPYVAKQVIVEFIKRQNPQISLEACHIESIYRICLKNGKTSIPKDYCCNVAKGLLTVRSEQIHNEKVHFSVNLSKKTQKINNLLLNNSLDCDKIVGSLVIRTRKVGDSIRLVGRGCTKPLTKLYNECGIAKEIRAELPVIADDNGVVWIHTVGVAQRCATGKSTKNYYLIEVSEN